MHTFIKICKEHKEYRQQIIKLAKSDIIKTYRGAALGWAWAIIKPTVTIFVYWFAFSIGLRSGNPVNGYPFFLWLIAGLIPWFYISEMLNQGTECIRKYKYLVTKMKYPVSTIPTFVSLAKAAINLILICIMLVIYIGFGYTPTIYWLQLPIYFLLSFLFWTIYAQFAGLMAAISRDFANLIKSLTTAIFWLSGILWNPDKVSIVWVQKMLHLNPVTFIVNGFRNCLINGVWIWEQPKRLMYFVIILLAMEIFSLWIYKKLIKEIPDVL